MSSTVVSANPFWAKRSREARKRRSRISALRRWRRSEGEQKRMHALLSQMIQLGQDRGEIRNDLPAAEIAHVFRQTIFGTLLIWSLYGDATLHSRIETAFKVLWTGLTPRGNSATALAVPLFTSGD